MSWSWNDAIIFWITFYRGSAICFCETACGEQTFFVLSEFILLLLFFLYFFLASSNCSCFFISPVFPYSYNNSSIFSLVFKSSISLYSRCQQRLECLPQPSGISSRSLSKSSSISYKVKNLRRTFTMVPFWWIQFSCRYVRFLTPLLLSSSSWCHPIPPAARTVSSSAWFCSA